MYTTKSTTRDSWTAAWSKHFSFWAILSVMSGLALTVVLMAFLQPGIPKTGLSPEQYWEFAGSLVSRNLYLVEFITDAIVWLSLAGIFTSLAALFWRSAPVRSVYLALIAAGQLIGFTGTFVRLDGMLQAARFYGNTLGIQRDILLRAVDVLTSTMSVNFDAASLLWGAGYVLAATVMWSHSRASRWAVALLGLSGILQLISGSLQILSQGAGTDIQMFAFMLSSLCQMIAMVALAWHFARRTQSVILETVPAPAN